MTSSDKTSRVRINPRDTTTEPKPTGRPTPPTASSRVRINLGGRKK
ncbi:hypothetical protein ACIQU4_27385 [Streptomyces sp. NPDC090741]